ncbi:MAG TPA: hypothetical protein VMZ92_07985 [Planctomycetota bacterium]|nr:hypothetical protein [Planctomycetota bacterium]
MTATFLSAAEIFAAEDLKVIEEPVPEWPNPDGTPGVIRLRQMTAEESIQMTRELEGARDEGMFIILVHSAVDAEGKRIFPLPAFDDPTYKDVLAGHVTQLKKKSMRALNRLQRVCLELNSMTPESKAALKKA